MVSILSLTEICYVYSGTYLRSVVLNLYHPLGSISRRQNDAIFSDFFSRKQDL